jgi:hypothetical protein
MASAGGDGERAINDAIYTPRNVPRTAPVFSRFLPGPAGEMWVEDYELVPGPSRRFVVFDARGVPAARVATPRSLAIHVIAESYVWGVEGAGDGFEDMVRIRYRR